MGLTERRAAKDFQDKHYPQLLAEIKAVAGDVPVEVMWEELAEAGYSHLYNDSWPELYFKPIIEGLRQITRDDIGKEAVKASLKKIQIRNAKGAFSPHSAISFDNGTLVIDHKLSNVGDTLDRTKYLIEIVEKGL